MAYGTISIMGEKTIGAAQFKEQCLAILDEVGPEGIIVTKHGKPVAKLIPIEADSAELIGSLEGEIEIKGDILSTGVTWNAESRHSCSSLCPRRQSQRKGANATLTQPVEHLRDRFVGDLQTRAARPD